MYILHGHPPESLEEAKYFGLTTNRDIKWRGKHVNNVYTKVNKTFKAAVSSM